MTEEETSSGSPSEAEPPQASEKGGDPDEEVDSIEIKYAEASDYKVVHVDGVRGRLSPNGYLVFDLYNERMSLPDEVEHRVDEKGNLGELVGGPRKLHIERRKECGVLMDLDTLVEVREWLDRQIRQIQQMQQPDDDQQRSEE